MVHKTIYRAGKGEALRWACRFLAKEGISSTDRPGPEVTHLLLPVPSFQADGTLKGGGDLGEILAALPRDIMVLGGNLSHPALAGYKTIDLLQDGEYTAKNAAITADCAIRVAGQNLQVVFDGCPILVIGWGRIGKCLAKLLQGLGAQVTVAARKETDRNLAGALGFGAVDAKELTGKLRVFRVIFNTAPAMVLTKELAEECRPGCLKIELASRPGIAGDDVVSALGLPGKMAPESSGKLMAQTIIRRLEQEEGL